MRGFHLLSTSHRYCLPLPVITCVTRRSVCRSLLRVAGNILIFTMIKEEEVFVHDIKTRWKTYVHRNIIFVFEPGKFAVKWTSRNRVLITTGQTLSAETVALNVLRRSRSESGSHVIQPGSSSRQQPHSVVSHAGLQQLSGESRLHIMRA